jgi:hypothetical protein
LLLLPLLFQQWHHGYLCGSRLSSLVHRGLLGLSHEMSRFSVRVVDLANRLSYPILLESQCLNVLLI